MATSRIEIIFNADLRVNELVYFEKKYDDGHLASNWQPVLETWKSFRSGPNEVTVNNATGILGERSAINFQNAINLDYLFHYESNNYLVNGVTRINNKVIIKVDRFWNFRLGTPNPNLSNVSIQIFNFQSPFFNITDISFGQAPNPCAYVLVNVTTNQLATNIIVPNIGANIG